MHWKSDPLRSGQANPATLDLRHLEAFQHVYMARDYTEAGHDLHTNRKGIRRMIERLEKTFQCPLFAEQERGLLVPSPFAERLFNDLRFLNAAQQSLEEQVRTIRESGRTLRIGSSASIFRTQVFRNLFRELQTFEGVRASYIPVKAEEAGKALASGVCDLHVGCWQGTTKRFISHRVGDVEFQQIVRLGHGNPLQQAGFYVVPLDGLGADFTPPSSESTWQAVPESQLLQWLDHPEDCPAGTRILMPDIPRDPRHWATEETPAAPRPAVYLNFLRQHPFEFLTGLGTGLQSRMNRK